MRPGPAMSTGFIDNVITFRARIDPGAMNGAPTGIDCRGRIYAPRAAYVHGGHR